jgi:hypothetical protein
MAPNRNTTPRSPVLINPIELDADTPMKKIIIPYRMKTGRFNSLLPLDVKTTAFFAASNARIMAIATIMVLIIFFLFY